MLTVYVPADTPEGRLLAMQIDPRSGIVGTPVASTPERVLLDYEGNRYGASNIVTYAERVLHAAGRHTTHYPTVARMVAEATAVVPVGAWDDVRGEVRVTNAPALAAWLEVPAVPPDELLAHNMAWDERRAVERLKASSDPADQRRAAEAEQCLAKRRR